MSRDEFEAALWRLLTKRDRCHITDVAYIEAILTLADAYAGRVTANA